MDREWLARRLEEGASYEELARECGCSPSKVAYWARKHGIASLHAPRSAPRGGIGREVLAELVAAGATTREIAERLGCSQTSVRHWLGRHGLATSAAAERSARLAARRETVGALQRCPVHGLTRHDARTSGVRCSRCAAEQVARRRRRIKEILVREAGGRCRLCGYDRCIRALEFHHVDPGEKRFAIARDGLTRSLDAVRAEAAKCVLLCSNCHAEVEDGLVELSLTSRAGRAAAGAVRG